MKTVFVTRMEVPGETKLPAGQVDPHSFRAGRRKKGRLREEIVHSMPILSSCVRNGKVDMKALARQLDELDKDPVRLAMFYADALNGRKPQGSALIAGNKALGEPMLVANHDTIASGLDKGQARDTKHVKDKVVRFLMVKPNSTKSAKYCKGWLTREWKICSLKWSNNFVILDHEGNEAGELFPSIGKALAAVKQAGLTIIK